MQAAREIEISGSDPWISILGSGAGLELLEQRIVEHARQHDRRRHLAVRTRECDRAAPVVSRAGKGRTRTARTSARHSSCTRSAGRDAPGRGSRTSSGSWSESSGGRLGCSYLVKYPKADGRCRRGRARNRQRAGNSRRECAAGKRTRASRLLRCLHCPWATSLSYSALVTDELAALFAAGPDPERSRARSERVLEAAAARDSARLERARAERPEALGRVLRALCGTAPFLAATLAQRPELFFELVEDDLSRPRSARGLSRAARRCADGASRSRSSAATLRRFKYAELARITRARPATSSCPRRAAEETLRELSHLAEALLAARARALARRDVERELGPPRWRDADGRDYALRFWCSASGKLGGEELNYSSDVDLDLRATRARPPTAEPLAGGPGGRDRRRVLRALARRFGRLVGRARRPRASSTASTSTCAPRARSGPLVLSSDALLAVLRRLGRDLGEGRLHEGAAGRRRPALRLEPRARDRPDDLPLGDGLRGRRAIREMKERIERERAQRGRLRRQDSAPAASATSSSSPRRCSSCTAGAFRRCASARRRARSRRSPRSA